MLLLRRLFRSSAEQERRVKCFSSLLLPSSSSSSSSSSTAPSSPPAGRRSGIKVSWPGSSAVAELEGPATAQAALSAARAVAGSAASGDAVALMDVTSGQIIDLVSELPSSPCHLSAVLADSPHGLAIVNHTAAHVAGAAVEALLGDPEWGPPAAADLRNGPSTAAPLGFFYEFGGRALPEGRTQDEFVGRVGALALSLARAGHRMERREAPDLAAALEVIGDVSPWKRAAAEAAAARGERLVFYRCGPFVDLCRGPHLPSLSLLGKGGLKIARLGAAADGAGRVYGVAFPSKALLAEHEARLEEAAKRDHRVIGTKQKLFLFHDSSPGSAFFLPHGALVYRKLVDFIRSEYRQRGFDEVMTPIIYHRKLWETSGHWTHYRDDMFLLHNSSSVSSPVSSPPSAEERTCCPSHAHAGSVVDEPEVGLKPMNCPGHCVIFASASRSYRELPLRLADFSPLHRNEASGALSGLTRARLFHQDDAHIFCTPDQVAGEITSCLAFVRSAYERFGLPVSLRLSTRPALFVGDVAEWDRAEAALKAALDGSRLPWVLNEGDGAFYGPKIDVAVTDAIGRQHQTATVQLDFQLPKRFSLEYTGEDGARHTPVMVHRAVLGSVERLMAILIEHHAGKWPLWLSPRQVLVCTVSDAFEAHAKAVLVELKAAGYEADMHLQGGTISKKVRDGVMLGYNYVAVIGAREAEAGTVALRSRDTNKDVGNLTIPELKDFLGKEMK
jgi:threonyl-tRNA synthetase